MTNSDLPSRLLKIRRDLLSMLTLVDARVERVVEALARSDFDAAREVRHGDREVDEMELDIEAECIEVLALHQPVAGDLRFIIACLRINNEVERIGDLAKGVAKRIIHLNKLGFLRTPGILGDMSAAVRDMLSLALTAVADNDADLARRIRRGDTAIDELQRNILEWTQQELAENGTSTEAAIDTMIVARGLERIGDMCTNIAEEVIFMVEGEVVRHTHA